MLESIVVLCFLQIIQIIGLFGLVIEISKTLKELEKDAVQDNNQDV